MLAWINTLPKPRTDIQTALEVIGRRDPDRINGEEARETRGGTKGYRLDLRGTSLQRAGLSHLNFDRALLNGARMEGAVLWRADLRSADWAGTRTDLPAQSADFRGAKNLSQAQLDQMTGNTQTLLPLTLEDGTTPTIPSCWKTPPAFFDAMIETMDAQFFWENSTADEIRAEILCPPGGNPHPTGTPLALDAPYPDGHPLANRN